MKKTLCSGVGCPLKYDCDHYSLAIDKMIDDFFDHPPYRPELKKCSFNKQISDDQKHSFLNGPIKGDL